MFVWLSFSQTLTTVIAGCEAAWGFFGGRLFVDPVPHLELKPLTYDPQKLKDRRPFG